MNSEKVESIFRRVRPLWNSGYDYPRRTSFINWTQNGFAIWWGCQKAERLAATGCAKFSSAFWVWAMDCYHWRAEGSPTREEYELHLEGDQRIEVRLLRAAHCMWTWGVDFPWFDLVRCRVGKDGEGVRMRDRLSPLLLVALSSEQISLLIDALNRGLEPQTALWPKPRRNRKYIALMTAAQTIAQHETEEV